MKQSGGHIAAYSEPGKGTTFKVYLPRAPGHAEPEEQALAPAAPPARSGTILLVEDDAPLREMIAEVLEAEGYDVLSFGDVVEALDAARHGDRPIHLVLTDMVMPKLSGTELIEELRKLDLSPGVLYMSGYTQERIARVGELPKGVAFIEKPFTALALVDKVREVLEAN